MEKILSNKKGEKIMFKVVVETTKEKDSYKAGKEITFSFVCF